MFDFFQDNLRFNQKLKQKSKNKKEIPDLSWAIFGFSFGGLIASDFALSSSKNIKEVFLFAPWFSTHRRLINNFTKIYLLLFRKIFNYDSLMNLNLQQMIFEGDNKIYLNLYKNLTDNEKFLLTRRKDTRIFRVLSKKRLSEIYYRQRKIFKLENKKRINFYSFLPEKDNIVDSEKSIQIIKKWNGNFELLKDCFHDFLDYEDQRWQDFVVLLKYYLTKIIK